MKRFSYLVIFIILISGLQSCYKDVGPIEPEGELPQNGISYAEDVQPIFDQNCIACHPSSGNLDLTSGQSYNQLVNVNASGYSGKRVVPNDAEASVLYKKIDGSGAYGGNMPIGSSLSTTQINIIKLWIEEGAQNN